MVAQAIDPGADVRLVTEIRGAAGRLWREGRGEIVISGPAGTGKTRAILEWIHQRCSQEKLRWLILRKTLESLKTSALVTYQEQVLYGFDGKRAPLDGVSYFGGNRIKPAQFTYQDTGSVIILGGLDNVTKVFSTEYDGIYVNEANELALDDWEKLGGRTDRPRVGPQRPASVVVGDCNPDAPTHWIKQRANEGRLQLWPTTHRDNPAMWDRLCQQWTPAGRQYMARLDGLTGVRRRRLRDGLWVAAEGQVYDAWRDDIHLVERADVADQLAGAWHLGTADWGWTNAGVLHVWAVDGDGRAYLVAEHYHTRQPVDSWWIPRAKELDQEFRVREWRCDPSEPAYIAQFQAAGLKALAATNDLMPGINAVQDRLVVAGDGRPRLMILNDALRQRDEALVEARLPWCTAQEIPEYVWAKNAGGQTIKDKPVDAHNHGMDAMRYGVAELDLKPRPAIVGPQIVAHRPGSAPSAHAAPPRVAWPGS